MSALDSEASGSSFKMPKSTSDGHLILHTSNPQPSSSSQGSITPPLPSDSKRKMKPFILRAAAKSPVPPQGAFDIGSPPSTSQSEMDRMMPLAGGSGSGKGGLTRTTSMDAAHPINKRASAMLAQQAPPPLPKQTRHTSKPSRTSSTRTDNSQQQIELRQQQARIRKPRPASVVVSASELRNAQAVEALKIKRQKEAALGKRYSTVDINIHPGHFMDSTAALAEVAEDGPAQRVARREASLGDLTNGQRSAASTSAAKLVDKENLSRHSSRSSLSTPKKDKALRRIASATATASPLRTPTRQARTPSKAASYSNLNSTTKRTPVTRNSEKVSVKAESPVHFTSMQDLLEEQGFQHTRVFTPQKQLRAAVSSASLLQHNAAPTAPPSPPMLSKVSPTATSPTLLGANLSAEHSLRPKSSMLSLRGLLSLWSASGAPVDGGAVAQIPPSEEQYGPLNPIDFNEGGSELGSDDTTVERRLVRASAWAHHQAGHLDDEFSPQWNQPSPPQTQPQRMRAKFGSADAERSMAYSSFGLRVEQMAIEDDEELIATLDGQSVAEAYAAGYRQAMEQQKFQRPPVLRTASHLAEPINKRHSLRHVVSESALAHQPASPVTVSQEEQGGYQSFGFASAGLSFNLDFEDEPASPDMDGDGGRTGSVRYEYDGSSNGGSEAGDDAGEGDAGLTVPVASRTGMLTRPMSSIWSGVGTLTHKASTLFFGPSAPAVPAIEIDSAADSEDENGLKKPQLLKKASSAAIKLQPVVFAGNELDRFDWGMDMTGNRK